MIRSSRTDAYGTVAQVEIDGAKPTMVHFTFPCGHTSVTDYGKKPIARRLDAAGVRFMVGYWQRSGGCYAPCPKCQRAQGRRADGRPKAIVIPRRKIMSSTSRGGQRVDLDVYETPEWAVHRLLDHFHRFYDGTQRDSPIRAMYSELGLSMNTRWCEPCAGRGNILREVETWRAARSVAARSHQAPLWTAAEIRPDCEPILRTLANRTRTGDWLIAPPEPVELTLTNPPFARAMDFVRKTRAESLHAIHLLRLNFLGSEERSDFIRETRPDIHILPNRCEFAMAVRCKGRWGRPRNAKRPILLGPACAWKAVLPLTEPRPTACPQCDGRVQISTTDSVEYAWFHWWPGASGRYVMLDSTPIEQRKTKELDEDPGIE